MFIAFNSISYTVFKLNPHFKLERKNEIFFTHLSECALSLFEIPILFKFWCSGSVETNTADIPYIRLQSTIYVYLFSFNFQLRQSQTECNDSECFDFSK